MKNPSEVAAAVRIAGAARSALTKAMAQHMRDPWDRQVLGYEAARLLGMLLRSQGTAPQQFEAVVQFLREVYAGVNPGTAMTVEQAVEHFCGIGWRDELEGMPFGVGTGGSGIH